MVYEVGQTSPEWKCAAKTGMIFERKILGGSAAHEVVQSEEI